MLFGSNAIIGLDIGTSSIKLVEVEGSKKNLTMTNFGYMQTPPGAVMGGEIVNPQAVAETISRLVNQTGVKTNRVCTGIWGTAVICKKISIPRIDEKVLSEQLRWEAEQYIPFDINEINLGFHVLAPSPSNPEVMNILLVAAKRDFVSRYAEVVHMAGLKCELVDVSSFALSNCFEANYGQAKNQTVGVLNVGAGVTNFAVIENGEVAFARDIIVGGNTFTIDIQKTLGVSMEEAESLKISAGTGQPVPKEVTDSIVQTNETVAEELLRSYEFYLSNSAGNEASVIYVTGGGMGVPGLFEQIQSSFKIRIEHLNPFKAIKADRRFTSDYLAQISPYVSVGLGLAMRWVVD